MQENREMNALAFSKAVNTLRGVVVRSSVRGGGLMRWYDVCDHPMEMAKVKTFFCMVKVMAKKAGSEVSLELVDDIQKFETDVLTAYFEFSE